MKFNGDRIAVNINREIPGTDGTIVLWDGGVLLAERGKVVPWTDPTRLQPIPGTSPMDQHSVLPMRPA